MAYRRRVFATIGEFDPALDVGTVTQGGGDLDMFFRVMQHGLVLVYEPAAIVRHRHRRTQGGVHRQLVGWGSGFYAYLARNAAMQPRARAAIVRFGLWYFWTTLHPSAALERFLAARCPPSADPGRAAWRHHGSRPLSAGSRGRGQDRGILAATCGHAIMRAAVIRKRPER